MKCEKTSSVVTEEASFGDMGSFDSLCNRRREYSQRELMSESSSIQTYSHMYTIFHIAIMQHFKLAVEIACNEKLTDW